MDDDGDVPPRHVAHQVPHRHRDVATRGADSGHEASPDSDGAAAPGFSLGEGGDVGDVEGVADAGHAGVDGGRRGSEDGDDAADSQNEDIRSAIRIRALRSTVVINFTRHLILTPYL